MRKIIYAFIASLVLLIISYFVNNLSIPLTGGENILIKRYEKLIKQSSIGSFEWADSILFVNTSFDLELIDHYDDYKIPNGKEAITNRNDLYTFLNCVSKLDYKYIILDIDIMNYNTDYSDSLKNLVFKMDNICIPISSEFKNIDKDLLDISGKVDYRRTINSPGFSKYELITGDTVSIPLKVYQDYNNKGIKRICGILFFDGYKLCQKSLIIHHYIKELGNADYCYYSNLGVDILNGSDLGDIVKNKFIVIGDCCSRNDMHDTYVGELSGPIINMNSYLNLANGKHLVNWLVVFILFIVYGCINILLLDGIGIRTILARYRFFRQPIIKIIVSFISYSTVFHIISFLLFISIGYHYNLWLPILWFTIMPIVIEIKETK